MRQFLILLLIWPVIAAAQVSDDFSDSDFTGNPAWSGDAAEFQVDSCATNCMLGSHGPQASSTIYLSTANTLIDSIEWRFELHMGFNPTSTNKVRIYLVADQQDLTTANGYFIELGETGGTNHIRFYKKVSGLETLLFTGSTVFNATYLRALIRVIRDNNGNWYIFSDKNLVSPVSEGASFMDNSIVGTAWFGVYCKYQTASRYNLYHFDNFYIGQIVSDTTAPYITSVTPSANTLDVRFNESLDPLTSANLANYGILGVGSFTGALLDPGNDSLVHLTYAPGFTNGVLYKLTALNVEDLSGNPMDPDTIAFAIYIPRVFDVVINEIMADPDPAVGLPNYEYIELFNRTQVPVSLKDWNLVIGTSDHFFPDVTVEADSFLILSGTAAQPLLSAYGPCVGFSSFSLTNSGTDLVLKNANGHTMHSISYDLSWYHDPVKDDGGWSIEQIDPDNPCAGVSNWNASVSILGGTPGAQNSVNAANPDNTAPVIMSVAPLNFHTLLVSLSETILPDTINLLSHFVVDNNVGTPSSVIFSVDNRTATLQFDSSFQNNVVYALTITDTLSDCVGNYTATDSRSFSLYQPLPYELLINEIMADPDPAIGLPALEYIELYNRTAFPVSLHKWTLLTGTTVKAIPDITVPASGYLIISETGSQGSFLPYGTIAEISGFSLVNSGETVALMDTLHNIISSVAYSDQWYQSNTKAAGGWSLEQIDPANPCGESANWIASNDPSGGTPGKINSVNAANPDNTAPRLVRASVSQSDLTKVRLFFSEALDSASLQSPALYTIDNGFGNPLLVKLVPYDFRSVLLNLTGILQYDVIYTVTVSSTIKDCAGNLLPLQSSVRFAVPRMPDSGDLVINEILSDPLGDGVDYVEIYNRSNKVFDFSDLDLASYDTLAGQVISVSNIAPEGYLIFPGDYVAVTEDPVIVKQQYSTPNPDGFAQMSSMPSYNNDDGIVVLCTHSLSIIDMAKYTPDMQFPLLNTTDGVSLERINFNRPASDKSNWHSAAEAVGFGTPAYKNSQYSEIVADDGAVTLTPDIFSPDNDGSNDVLNISYNFAEPGFVANIVVYDASGRLTRRLVDNQLLGTSGVYTWDGTTDDREKASIGIYVVYFEVFGVKGDVKRYKRAAVLAGKFR
jgi:hypothetical protein